MSPVFRRINLFIIGRKMKLTKSEVTSIIKAGLQTCESHAAFVEYLSENGISFHIRKSNSVARIKDTKVFYRLKTLGLQDKYVEAAELWAGTDREAESVSEEGPISELVKHWELLADNRHTLSSKDCLSLQTFVDALGEDEVVEAMDIAADRVSTDHIENRFRYFCGVCHSKIRTKSGDTSDEVFNKARYYFRKQSSGSGYLREQQLRLFSRRYPLSTIKEAIDVAFSCRRSNYWNAVCEALADITGEDIEI